MEKSSTPVRVVAVALIDSRGAVLMQQRPPEKMHGGLWEFPGGKIEPGEAPESAACREIAEELGIVIAPADLAWVTMAMDDNAAANAQPRHVIDLYTCRRWQGEPECRDAAALAWVPVAAIPVLAMPPLDYPLAEALISSI